MRPVSCVITDDEPMARKGIARYVEKVPYLQLVGMCEDALQLQQLLNKKKVDLLFLDIQMPGQTGINLLKNLTDPPKVIFTTAYEEYALQGYELDILDYLLKPVSFERFLKAVSKAADYFATQQASSNAYFFIKVDGRLEKVLFNEIICVEALQNYVALYTIRGKFITHSTLKSMQQNLPDSFIQTHKSWLVNSMYIDRIEPPFLYCGNIQVPISKYLKAEVMQMIKSNKTL
ncbi:MAG: response regulator transcription factor [Chitinophagaceae bacterium]|nr:response regulator transcription factor [Chitinophagaceae bacterium]